MSTPHQTKPEELDALGQPRYPYMDESGTVDLSQIDCSLALTPVERLRRHSEFVELIQGVRLAGRVNNVEGERPMGVDFQLLQRLNDYGVDFVVVGGLAAIYHGSVTFTYDIDVCVSFQEPNLSRITNCLRDLNPRARMRPDKMRMPDPLPTNLKNLYLDTDRGVIDFLGEVSGIGGYDEVAARSVRAELQPGIVCKVLDLDGLIDSNMRPAERRIAGMLLNLK
jgi:hypothetical protein